MKKYTQKRKASKIKNEYILVLEAISKVLTQFTRVENLNEHKFNREPYYSFIYPDLSTNEMVKVVSAYTGLDRQKVRKSITFLRLNDYIDFKDRTHCKIIKKIDFKEIVRIPEYFKIAAKNKKIVWTEFNQKVLDYISKRKGCFEYEKKESQVTDEELEDFREHGMTFDDEKFLRINRYKWQDCDPVFYEKKATIAFNLKCSIGTVKNTIKKLKVLFGREVSFKDTPVEKVRRVHYSHSYRIELPDRREWKDILLKEFNSLYESVIDGRRKVIDTLRDVVWDRQDEREEQEREKKKKEGIFCSEYTRISKQDFDANVGVQYSVLMGFKKKTYTAIEEKEEYEEEDEDYEEENNYTEKYEEEDFDNDADDLEEYEEKEYRWNKYRCHEAPEYEGYDPNEFEVY
jgi:hypothetical protein|nr:MAG TPA: hypothetical protein [Caudoviricetes sp.]